MSIETILFFGFAALAVLPALAMLIMKNVLHIALMLLLSLLGVAAIYVFLQADFIAITQVMVYVGGVLVLLLFGVMFTQNKDNQGILTESSNITGGIIASVSMLGLFVYAMLHTNLGGVEWINQSNILQGSTINLIGKNLMTNYILAFELAAVLLLVVLIGAAYIAGSEDVKTQK